MAQVNTYKRQTLPQADLICLYIIMKITIIALLILFPIFCYAQEYTNEQIADAIYLAEGGKKAKKPYGILSVPCENEAECRVICLNTIRNNRKRFKKQDKYTNYLEFLASRYAPINAENDPQGLNHNWLKNVEWFLNAPKSHRKGSNLNEKK